MEDRVPDIPRNAKRLLDLQDRWTPKDHRKRPGEPTDTSQCNYTAKNSGLKDWLSSRHHRKESLYGNWYRLEAEEEEYVPCRPNVMTDSITRHCVEIARKHKAYKSIQKPLDLSGRYAGWYYLPGYGEQAASEEVVPPFAPESCPHG